MGPRIEDEGEDDDDDDDDDEEEMKDGSARSISSSSGQWVVRLLVLPPEGPDGEVLGARRFCGLRAALASRVKREESAGCCLVVPLDRLEGSDWTTDTDSSCSSSSSIMKLGSRSGGVTMVTGS